MVTLEPPHAEERGRKDPVTGDAPQWAQDRAKELLDTAPQDMVLWMVLAHGLAMEREQAALIADDAMELRERLFRENGGSTNAARAIQAEEIGTAIRDYDWRREQQKDETR